MKTIAFAKRNIKEILRDPLTVAFSLGFPLTLVLLLSAIQANIPTSLFEIDHLAPGICVFGLSFMTLFSATLIAKDRESSFLQRLYTTPLTAWDFILGYMLPILPIAIMQTVICYVVSMFLGLTVSVNLIISIVFIVPISLLYISLGLLCGSVFNVKQVGGICGALLTNLSAWLSGIWFDIEIVGGVFKRVASTLPFVHAVELEREIVNGNFDNIFYHLIWVIGYTVIIFSVAVIMFFKQMKNQ